MVQIYAFSLWVLFKFFSWVSLMSISFGGITDRFYQVLFLNIQRTSIVVAVKIPVDGQNLAVLSQGAGKAAYSLEYGFVHSSAISTDGG